MATVKKEHTLSTDGIHKDEVWVCNDTSKYHSHQYLRRYGEAIVLQSGGNRRLGEAEVQLLDAGKCPDCIN